MPTEQLLSARHPLDEAIRTGALADLKPEILALLAEFVRDWPEHMSVEDIRAVYGEREADLAGRVRGVIEILTFKREPTAEERARFRAMAHEQGHG